jgi:asparagine synthase (glutamine-hydrolysing)
MDLKKLPKEKDWKSFISKLKRQKTKSDKEALKESIVQAIKSRTPNKKFGILFSGGVDSSLIALICKILKKNFTCYAVGLKKSEDVAYAKRVAKHLKLKLKVITLSEKDAKEVIEKTTKLLKEPNVVKVGVASVVYAAMEAAKKDKITHFFSGLGSEEIFAGYERHIKAKDINKECWKGLSMMWERDLVRDFTTADHFKNKILVPFLDKKVIKLAMGIPADQKISEDQNKLIVRKIANELGLKETYAYRKKRAAQYGSRIDRFMRKLAKRNGFKYKKEYLASLLKPKLGVLFSSGKDSTYAFYKMQQQGHQIKCLINIKSANPDSYMYHTPNLEMVPLQAKALNIPLVRGKTKGVKEKELKDLKKTLKIAIKKYGIEGITTGALYSNYQRERIEKICKKLNIECFSPLWHMDQEEYMREIVNSDFKFILTKIAAYGLDKTWLGKVITEKDVDKLAEINKKIGINVAFEGGEAESLIIDGPNFEKRIKIKNAEIIMENDITGTYEIKEAKLVNN